MRNGAFSLQLPTPQKRSQQEYGFRLFCHRLYFLRKRRKLSRVELSGASGVSASQIAQYELGHCQPTIPMVEKLSKALDVSPEYLCGWASVPLDPDPSDD